MANVENALHVPDVDRMYHLLRTSDHTTNQHTPLLRALSSGCNTVIELGTGRCLTSWAFIKGLLDNTNGPKRFITCDIVKDPNVGAVRSACENRNIEFEFIEGNDLDYMGWPEADMVWIDTWHVYGHLKRELAYFSNLTSLMVLHDTSVDHEVGESVRLNSNIEQQMEISGYSREEIERGIWPAVEEFVAQNPSWYVEARYLYNNGLTILRSV